MENVQSLMEKNSELFRQAYNEKIQLCLDHILFTWRWWISVAVIIICFGFGYENKKARTVWNIFMIPTMVMLLLLVKPEVNPWIKAIFLGAITSFLGLPLLNWLGLYETLNWRYIYSFPIMMMIYLLAHFISRREKFARL